MCTAGKIVLHTQMYLLYVCKGVLTPHTRDKANATKSINDALSIMCPKGSFFFKL